MEMSFCRRCGAPLTHRQRLAFECTNGHTIFANPSPCARILVLSANNEFILQIRGIEPYKGRLDTFGGFVEENESLEAAAVRELHEETGITKDDFEALHFVSSDVAPYPYNGEVLTSLIATFFVRLHENVVPTARQEVDSIKVIPIDQLVIEQLTTPEIQQAARTAIRLIKEKVL